MEPLDDNTIDALVDMGVDIDNPEELKKGLEELEAINEDKNN